MCPEIMCRENSKTGLLASRPYWPVQCDGRFCWYSRGEALLAYVAEAPGGACHGQRWNGMSCIMQAGDGYGSDGRRFVFTFLPHAYAAARKRRPDVIGSALLLIEH